MSVDETIVLDPAEFIDDRVELELDQIGLAVREVDWGEATMETFLIKQAKGEIPADRHPPNQTVSVKLRVKEEAAVSLPEIAQKLQQKVGIIQDENGWVRRDFDTAAGFARSVAYPIYGANLKGLYGWMFAHNKLDHEVTLTLTRGPYCYGVGEEVLADHSETSAKELVFTEQDLKGTAPGLMRLTVDNDSTNSWQGVIGALESRYYSADPTAELVYEAEALTPLGGAAIATRSGASGGGSNNVIRHTSLSNNFQAILGSTILSGTAAMTHKGPRKIMARIYDPGSVAGEVELRLEWRSLKNPVWTPKAIVSTPLVANFAIVNLGEVMPRTAIVGSHQWEWRIVARTTGTAGADIDIDRVWVLPAEQIAVVKSPLAIETPSAFTARSEFDTEAGVIVGDPMAVGGNWALPGGGTWDATDFSAAAGVATRSEVSDGGSDNQGRADLAGAGVLASMSASVDIKISAAVTGAVNKYGMHFRYVNNTNFAGVYIQPASASFQLVIGRALGSNSMTNIVTSGNVAPGLSINTFYRLQVMCLSSGHVLATLSLADGLTLNPVAAVYGWDSAFVTAATLASGQAGLFDKHTGATAPTRTYDNYWFAAAEAKAVAYAGRSVDFRTEGVFTQHPTLDVWATMAAEGNNLFVPPSLLEDRNLRAIVLPSVGDFEQIPDSSIDDVSARMRYYPGYHFASEAA